MHDIDRLFVIERPWELIQILRNSFTLLKIEIRIDGNQLIGLIRGLDIGWIFLRRPECFWIIHLLVVFGSKWGGGDKGVTDEFISVLKPMTSPVEIDDSFDWLFEEIGVTQIPVSRDEEDLFDSGSLENSS